MFPSTSTRFVAFFLSSAVLLSQPFSAEAAAPMSDARDIAQRFIRHGDADVRLLNYTYDRSRTGTEDGCPVGWIECSFTTCYPLDGSQCCSSTHPSPHPRRR